MRLDEDTPDFGPKQLFCKMLATELTPYWHRVLEYPQSTNGWGGYTAKLVVDSNTEHLKRFITNTQQAFDLVLRSKIQITVYTKELTY